MFSAPFHNNQEVKLPKYPLTDEYLKKMWRICPVEYCSVLKRKEAVACATIRMTIGDIILSKIGQSQKDYVCSHLIRGIKSSQELETESRVTVARSWGSRGEETGR